MRREFRCYSGTVILNTGRLQRRCKTSGQLFLLVENCAFLCEAMDADGWAGYPEFVAVCGKGQMRVMT